MLETSLKNWTYTCIVLQCVFCPNICTFYEEKISVRTKTEDYSLSGLSLIFFRIGKVTQIVPLLASFSFQGTRTLSISGCRKGSDRKESVFVFAKIFKEIISWCCSKPPGYCNGVSNEGSKLSNIIIFPTFACENNKTTFLPNFPINWETNKDCMSKDWPKDTRTCRLQIYFTSNICFMGWKIKFRRANTKNTLSALIQSTTFTWTSTSTSILILSTASTTDSAPYQQFSIKQQKQKQHNNRIMSINIIDKASASTMTLLTKY